ncbi:hypothetical protein SUGI_0062950 [Cryptomeria japonica]|nr:hypothetical protein SUGI_0062950 [Cryptomeria japonica]
MRELAGAVRWELAVGRSLGSEESRQFEADSPDRSRIAHRHGDISQTEVSRVGASKGHRSRHEHTKFPMEVLG